MTLARILFFASPQQLSTTHLALAATLVILLVVQYVRSPWRKVPPGPKGLPILGNAFQLHNKGWMFESECKRQFGPSNSVFSLVDSMIHRRTLRTYDVLERPWSAHSRHK